MNIATITPEDMFERCMREFRKGGQPTAVPYPFTFESIQSVPDQIGGEKFSQAYQDQIRFVHKWVIFEFQGERCEAIIRLVTNEYPVMMVMFKHSMLGVTRSILADKGTDDAGATSFSGLVETKHAQHIVNFFFEGYDPLEMCCQPLLPDVLLSVYLNRPDFCSQAFKSLSESAFGSGDPVFWIDFLDWTPPA